MPQVSFTPNLRRHVECPVGDFEAATVAELFAQYFQQWPDVRGFVLDNQGCVRKHVKVLVDGHNVRDRVHLADKLEPTSEVHVFQALSGG